MSFASYYTRARSTSVLRDYRRVVEQIASLQSSFESVTDEELAEKFQALSELPAEQVHQRTVRGFAIASEACHRALGMRPFEVQLLGGLVLLNGRVAEMATGEGKTLTIVAPAALQALSRKGVHVVTANSYLAKRDAELMRPAYELLGLSVAHLDSDQTISDKKAAYAADICYGVGSEFGFDYLKDNLAKSLDDRVQRALNRAIVDEVDSILIDEARVPLIISKTGPDVSAGVKAIDSLMRAFVPDVHYTADLKDRNASLTDTGYSLAESELARLGLVKQGKLYDPENLSWVRRLHSAVKAYALMRADRDYVVEGGELVLVDIGTGRKMNGRRFEDGLHEALEAKEGLRILPGNLTAATITYQNFFGLYEGIGGLTGTALTDAEEFSDIYGMEVVVVPTNKPCQRKHLPDTIYASKHEKFLGAVESIARIHETGQPVLVGCASIRDAEVVSKLLTSANLAHSVLTAKHLAKEADIIANAGALGRITVATNMAGRGTDISLGGEKPERRHFESQEDYFRAFASWSEQEAAVLAVGGLHVLGTERNGLRRVDNQLAGRAGRQGNPGSVQFLMSIEDELLKVFSQSKSLGIVQKAVSGAGLAISGAQAATLVTRAQMKYEGQGFDARKQLMKFDSVLAEQRKVLYDLRDSMFRDQGKQFRDSALVTATTSICTSALSSFVFEPEKAAAELKQAVLDEFGINLPVLSWLRKLEGEESAELANMAISAISDVWKSNNDTHKSYFGLTLAVVDDLWSEHLTSLEELRQAANLKGHAGQNPLYQFTKEGYAQFEDFLRAVCLEVAKQILNPEFQSKADLARLSQEREAAAALTVSDTYKSRWILRSEQCPCGSDKLFKHCHGTLT